MFCHLVSVPEKPDCCVVRISLASDWADCLKLMFAHGVKLKFDPHHSDFQTVHLSSSAGNGVGVRCAAAGGAAAAWGDAASRADFTRLARASVLDSNSTTTASSAAAVALR